MRAIVAAIAERHAGSGIELVERGGHWHFQTPADLAHLLRRERDDPRKLSRAAADLIAKLEQQIEPFAPTRLLGRRVDKLAGEKGAFTLTTDQLRSAVLTGAMAPGDHPVRRLAARTSGCRRFSTRFDI